jgi:hypothetical protein
MGNKDLSKILPQFFANEDLPNNPQVPRELFEEAIHKIFPFSSPQVKHKQLKQWFSTSYLKRTFMVFEDP